MRRTSPTATERNGPLHRRALTVGQENAVDALVCGKTDAETAALVGVHRVTVTRWRLYDPVFQAALNVRRAEVWAVGPARLRALIPKAVDVLAASLEADGPERLRAAVELLKLVPPGPAGPLGPTDPEEIVRGVVEGRRRLARDVMADILDGAKGLPSLDEHVRQVWDELEERSAGEPTR